MKSIFFLLSVFCFLLLGCQNNTAEKQPATTDSNAQKTTDTLCFEFKFKQDVTSCQLIIDGDKVTGSYDWSPFEKDGGLGILLDGIKKGDMITVDWLYMIEGNVQKEELQFKLEGNKLIRMEGELVEKGDKLVLKSPQTAVSGDVLVNVDCTQIAKSIENVKLTVEALQPMKK